MASGRPVLSTPYSGVTEFFDDSVGYPVAYRVVQSSGAVYQGRWAEPDLKSLQERLRQVYGDRSEARRLGHAAAVRARRFTWEAMTGRLTGLLRDVGAIS
jgi:glycosyltransferase involved in cell wall biosynthesis